MAGFVPIAVEQPDEGPWQLHGCTRGNRMEKILNGRAEAHVGLAASNLGRSGGLAIELPTGE